MCHIDKKYREMVSYWQKYVHAFKPDLEVIDLQDKDEDCFLDFVKDVQCVVMNY